MKARLENGQPKVYPTIPKVFERDVEGRKVTVFGYNEEAESVHIADGFRDLIIPDHDEVLQQLDGVIQDKANDRFIYTVTDKIFDLEAERSKRLGQNDNDQRLFLKETDPYITRASDPTSGIGIPQWVLDERTRIRTRHEQIETEIMALTKVREVLTYQINYN